MRYDDIRSSFEYEPSTGHLLWVYGPDAGKPAGNVVNHPKYGPVRKIKIRSRWEYAHRVVWFYHHRELPFRIRHINGDSLDNRIENLSGINMAKAPSVMRDRSAAPPSNHLIHDAISPKPYVPPDPRDDPRLERDHTRNAPPVDTSRPSSWAAMARRRR